MTESNPLEFLKDLEKSGINLGLSAVSRLVKRLGDPQKKYKSVLIAGTNGKGSTAAMLASVLSRSGLKVGLYTSPHLSDFRERIRINKELISKSELSSLIRELRGALKEPVTYFEFTTALAFMHFCRRKVDIAVLEVGMGGRLDATNLVAPEVSIITNISLEHREFLGNSIRQISREKAGIIKRNGICITGASQPSALDVIEETCARKKSGLLVLGRDFRVRSAGDGSFNYCGIFGRIKGLKVPLLGKHQLKNAALALAAVEALRRKGIGITDEQVYLGLSQTRWEGRMEVLHAQPVVIADGAHNPAGITVLLKAIAENFKYKKLIFILGVLKDKDYVAMFRKVSRIADRVILTKPASSRGLDPACFGVDSKQIITAGGPYDALQKAFSKAGPRDLICATGSLYLIADIRKFLKQDK